MQQWAAFPSVFLLLLRQQRSPSSSGLSKSPGTFLPTIGRGIDREPSLSLRPKLSQQRAFFPRLLRSYPCWVPRVVVHGSPHSLFRPPPFMLGRGKEQEGRGMAVGEKCRGPLSFLFHVFPFFLLGGCLLLLRWAACFHAQGLRRDGPSQKGERTKEHGTRGLPLLPQGRRKKSGSRKKATSNENAFSLLGNKLFVFIERV